MPSRRTPTTHATMTMMTQEEPATGCGRPPRQWAVREGIVMVGWVDGVLTGLRESKGPNPPLRTSVEKFRKLFVDFLSHSVYIWTFASGR